MLQLPPYRIADVDQIESPGLIVFLDLVRANIDAMIAIAGSPERLRPHCKTHKTREIIRLLMDRGVTRHKCATIAEAEMLLEEGVNDVFLAYQPVGPNVQRVARLVAQYPAAKIAVAIDHPAPLAQLSDAVDAIDGELGVLLDLDSGMNRTGIELGESAMALYEAIASSPAIRTDGLHWYDGHVRQSDLAERTSACLAGWSRLIEFRNRLLLNGLPVPKIVAAGTGSFPILAEIDEPGLELSPGTVAYFDAGYRRQYPEMPFIPALAILTRVISCNRAGFLTLDVGHKACAADPPAGHRLEFPAWPDGFEVQHSEEHLVLRTAHAAAQEIGDATLAIPVHACPTSTAYEAATVIEHGQIVGTWEIRARRRKISI